MGNCKKPKGPLTVAALDKDAVLTPENAGREVLLLARNSAGCWAVKPMENLTLKALREALDNPRTAFLLLDGEEPEAPEDGGAGE